MLRAQRAVASVLVQCAVQIVVILLLLQRVVVRRVAIEHESVAPVQPAVGAHVDRVVVRDAPRVTRAREVAGVAGFDGARRVLLLVVAPVPLSVPPAQSNVPAMLSTAAASSVAPLPFSVRVPARLELPERLRVLPVIVRLLAASRVSELAIDAPVTVTANPGPISTLSPLVGSVSPDQLRALVHRPSPASPSQEIAPLSENSRSIKVAPGVCTL